MSPITSFDPIADPSASVLILGSMPGVVSLQHNQYYAHPRNAFWRIMGNLYHFSPELCYQQRTQALKTAGVAVWDVLHSCVRPGSLDSAIKTGSRVPNDFQTFFSEHPHIQTVGFNGAEAEKSFHRYVLPNIDCDGISFVRLPSSSPAHAIALEKKIMLWREKLI